MIRAHVSVQACAPEHLSNTTDAPHQRNLSWSRKWERCQWLVQPIEHTGNCDEWTVAQTCFSLFFRHFLCSSLPQSTATCRTNCCPYWVYTCFVSLPAFGRSYKVNKRGKVVKVQYAIWETGFFISSSIIHVRWHKFDAFSAVTNRYNDLIAIWFLENLQACHLRHGLLYI